jgi:hypothetical protein
VDSRLDDFAWADQVRKYLGDETVDEYLDLESTTHDDVYDFTYSSFERAMHFSVGWRSWPLTAECERMLPRLREAVVRSGHSEPFLVEIGAGAGAAAAIPVGCTQGPGDRRRFASEDPRPSRAVR